MTSANPISVAALNFFNSDAGKRLLIATQENDVGQSLKTQKLLRKSHSADLCRAALSVIEQRRKAAADKFPSHGSQLFIDREALEMASREEIAAYRAQRFGACDRIADLCCGAGSDTCAFAVWSRVVALDLNSIRLRMTQMNACTTGVGNRVSVVCGHGLHLPWKQVDAVFADPSRRRSGQRVRAAVAYEPCLEKLIALCRTIPRAAIKVAPGISYGQLPDDAEIEFISAAGQCREGVLYFGDLKSATRRATILPGNNTIESKSNCKVDVGTPGRFLYDPNPAVVRAHLIDELAFQLRGWKLDSQIAYISSDNAVSTPFARCYRVISEMPYNLQRLRKHLATEAMIPTVIKKRRFPIDPEELRRQLTNGLKNRKNTTKVTLILTRLEKSSQVFICEAIPN